MTREIIEKLGWKFKVTNQLTDWFKMELEDIPDFKGNARDYYQYPIYGMYLTWFKDVNRFKIYFNFTATTNEEEQDNDDKMFEGEIVSETELRLLMMWLKIIPKE